MVLLEDNFYREHRGLEVCKLLLLFLLFWWHFKKRLQMQVVLSAIDGPIVI